MEKNIEPNFRTDKNLMETLYSEGQYLGAIFETKKKYTHMFFDILGWDIFPSWGLGEM